MTHVEALHELRRMAQPQCWRCEGKRTVSLWSNVTGTWRESLCPGCLGTGSPERAR